MMFFSVTGRDNLIGKLKLLPVRMRKQALMRAARVAMRPIMAEARATAPQEGGALRKSIRLRAIKRKTTSKSIGVRVASSEQWFVGDEYYGAFQEFGWRVGKRTKELRRKNAAKDTRRQIPGKHYMEDTYRRHGDKAIQVFYSVLPREISKLVAELKTKEEWKWFFKL